MIEEFLALFSNVNDASSVFSVNEVVMAMLLSFGLSLLIAWVYKLTYTGVSYTQSYVHTLILMSIVVTVIMMIIGSNIARAFSLVGALSIVRFRNAMKDTRDVGYVFFALAEGMACGTGFYTLAIVSTIIICFVLWLLAAFDLFARDSGEQILKIRLPGDMRYETLFDKVFNHYLSRFKLIAVEVVQAGLLTEVVYGVELKRRVNTQEFMNELSRLNGNNKIALLTGYHEVDL